ncbi:energy transducer TonB, partial [Myxococcota bacterium]|nr:energy transducer TonB [Myxococcota bacterium]
PTPKTHVSPLYPRDAERQGIEGEVLLRLLVNADGEVEQVVILSSNPPKIFDRAAAMAAEAWRFSPGKMGGRAVPVWVRKRIAFALE